MTFDSLCTMLKENKLKLTVQRKCILATLYENKDSLMSAEDILAASKSQCSKLNLSTIYRNLEFLKSLDLLYTHVQDNESTLYKLKLKYAHHHQMICMKCGKSEDIEFCPIATFKDLIEEKSFNLKKHKLELYGHCKDCDDEK